MSLRTSFDTAARAASRAAGHPAVFAAAVLVIVGWAALGPVFGYSDTWQLVVNTGTTVITFLMVFLIQSTQNRDSSATLMKLEELSEAELDRVHKHFRHLALRARQDVRGGRPDTDGDGPGGDIGPFSVLNGAVQGDTDEA